MSMVNWLTTALAQYSLAWLVVSTIIALASGFISSRVTYHFKRREIIETALADFAKQRQLQAEVQAKERNDRVRQQIIEWANPIFGAVDDLEHRLRNILNDGAYVALHQDYVQPIDLQWSVTYDYFMPSTLYHFAQYFAWIQMLREELSFELFQSQQTKDVFFKAVTKVGRSLAEYPAPAYFRCSGTDTQVFWLQQRAIGELLILRDGDQRRCMNYSDFLDKLCDPAFERHLIPLKSLLQDVSPEPGSNCRWARLSATRQALLDLKWQCQQVLALPEEEIDGR